ncbi:ubiquinone biosynthesis O-methyltransferase [Schizophyllum commune H4-8]|uniref:Ubiquinone biosynthesis O-methyltransferase, mitochondrial n=1 Tax=Schizophyllum commune (strain H4-8 / FGSC 9210) TaxID=578458 RepID=D8Q1F7_SCHCM|nr:ubiquinone biosynthesis O-methyltransferase [Schizophyllum commune H4-8]KAI5895405.1 ubiquinone biosynthesis O-methyltransferase [Schizophyllum commune H4-8]
MFVPFARALIVARPRLARCLQTSAAVTGGSVNPEEIAFFSKLSSQWWDETGEFGFLHRMNPLRVQFIRDKLHEVALDERPDDFRAPGKNTVSPADVLRDLNVLDVGCGGGLLSESLARLGANTLAIDASQSNIQIASLHASSDPSLSPNLEYRHSAAEALVEEGKQFDVVCSMEVLEHVDHPAAFLDTCSRLLKPNGHLFLSTMARTPLAYFLTIFMAENVLARVSPGTHTYSKYINPSELMDHFKEVRYVKATYQRGWIGSQLPMRMQAEVRGMIYNPLSGRWSLAPRDAWGADNCNYVFWVRKPAVESK